ncbi:sialidase family protein [Fodinicola feengrottensis]|uniref:sialidase family protein n=1 Tax=Fodinicola feengrottensis TaxID=435914 RepID=UPI0024420EF6|nr:sialidase family protein [Fodinicola feengrottensis]
MAAPDRRLCRCCGVFVAIPCDFGARGVAAVPPSPVRVLQVGQIDEQDIAPQPGSEPDTLVEPDVAISPIDPRIAVAAAHDGRFPDGGAVDISYAWTHDSGKHWQHAPLQGVTKAAGGQFDRASDPVLTFGPDGSVYLSVLAFDTGCPTAVAVSRSTDGGQTFGRPVLAHYSSDCAYSDDKNFLIADRSPFSAHRGRLYQFWTPFLYDANGNNTAALQVVRWSDDHGRTWSKTVNLTNAGTFSQNSQPMIQPDGTIVDAYIDYGTASGGEAPESRTGHESTHTRVPQQEVADLLVARTSHDGGATWSAPTTITHDAGEGPVGIRCCLPSATADPVTGLLYAAWDSADPTAVQLSRSVDGTHWSTPVDVTHGKAGTDHVNVGVAAFFGRVYVSYGTRDTTVQNGRYVQQQLSTSLGGAYFGQPQPPGPLSDLNNAAVADGKFPGDYIGIAAGPGRAYAVWCRSSTPTDPTATYHQNPLRRRTHLGRVC